MKRLLTLCVAIVAALVIVAPSPAAKSGQGTGSIGFDDLNGCGFSGTTSDGQPVYAGGPYGFGNVSFKLLGGTSLLSPSVGWICEGTTFFTDALPPITGALVITGVTCSFSVLFLPPLGFVSGTLAAPGTAILYPGGRARLICPVSEVIPFP
jgi:hypothetical protein